MVVPPAEDVFRHSHVAGNKRENAGVFTLSIDIDWAHDTVIADTLELLEDRGAKATWFVTHASPILGTIREAGGHELGIHPNFNPLLDGESGRARDTVARILDVVPEARAVRSHSLTRSSRLSSLFGSFDLTHESNVFVPPCVGGALPVWKDVWGLVQVPIRWEDDIRLLDDSLGEPWHHLSAMKPFVVDFHPIHIYLNTTTIQEYEDAREHAQDPHALRRRRRSERTGGSRDRLLSLLDEADRTDVPRGRVSDLQPPSGR